MNMKCFTWKRETLHVIIKQITLTNTSSSSSCLCLLFPDPTRLRNLSNDFSLGLCDLLIAKRKGRRMRAVAHPRNIWYKIPEKSGITNRAKICAGNHNTFSSRLATQHTTPWITTKAAITTTTTIITTITTTIASTTTIQLGHTFPKVMWKKRKRKRWRWKKKRKRWRKKRPVWSHWIIS